MESFYSLMCVMGMTSATYLEELQCKAMDILSRLPVEIAVIIFRLLDPGSLLSSALVNRKWLRVCRGDVVLRARIRRQLRRVRRNRVEHAGSRVTVTRDLQQQSSNRLFAHRNNKVKVVSGGEQAVLPHVLFLSNRFPHVLAVLAKQRSFRGPQDDKQTSNSVFEVPSRTHSSPVKTSSQLCPGVHLEATQTVQTVTPLLEDCEYATAPVVMSYVWLITTICLHCDERNLVLPFLHQTSFLDPPNQRVEPSSVGGVVRKAEYKWAVLRANKRQKLWPLDIKRLSTPALEEHVMLRIKAGAVVGMLIESF
uniref:F-box domain-containing protein n=1 Tax=Timema bartmani TaxID=61472 RepID=A0A7R9I343_9NEOP|nr:unnamed protein product [Timema bartmani]